MTKQILRFLAWATLGSGAVTASWALGMHAASFDNLFVVAFIAVTGAPIIIAGFAAIGVELNEIFK